MSKDKITGIQTGYLAEAAFHEAGHILVNKLVLHRKTWAEISPGRCGQTYSEPEDEPAASFERTMGLLRAKLGGAGAMKALEYPNWKEGAKTDFVQAALCVERMLHLMNTDERINTKAGMMFGETASQYGARAEDMLRAYAMLQNSQLFSEHRQALISIGQTLMRDKKIDDATIERCIAEAEASAA